MKEITESKMYHSWFFLPINEKKFFEKIDQFASLVDTFVFDLEDAIFHTEKDLARENLKILKTLHIPYNKIAVRINHLNTKWGRADLEEAIQNGVTHIVYPKVNTAKEIEKVVRAANKFNRKKGPISITPIIESIEGLENSEGILNSSCHSQYIIFGSEDFLSNFSFVNRGFIQDNVILSYSLAKLSIFCAKHHKFLIDCAAPYFSTEMEMVKFEQECIFTQKMGAIGKLAIHPKQLSIISKIFNSKNYEAIYVELINEIEEISNLMFINKKSVLKYKNRLVGIPELKKYFNRIYSYLSLISDDSKIEEIKNSLKRKFKRVIT